MGMFDTTGTGPLDRPRKPTTLEKLERINKALRHEEPDREHHDSVRRPRHQVGADQYYWEQAIECWVSILIL